MMSYSEKLLMPPRNVQGHVQWDSRQPEGVPAHGRGCLNLILLPRMYFNT